MKRRHRTIATPHPLRLLSSLVLTLVLVAAPAFAVEPGDETETGELLPNARTPAPGLLTGGQPSPEQLEHLARQGYRTVVSLRTDDEEGTTDPDFVKKLGMAYFEIPVDGAAGLTPENVHGLSELLEDESLRPMVVHCSSGNRVGALIALEEHWVGRVPPEEALARGEEAGLTRLEPEVRDKLRLPPD